MDANDDQCLLNTPAKSTPSSHIYDKSSIISTPVVGSDDNEIARQRACLADSILDQESATMNNVAGPSSQSVDLSAKSVELLPSFGITTPEKSIPLRPNSHVSAESLIIPPPQEQDLEIVTERASIVDPTSDPESTTTGIQQHPLTQCHDLNGELTTPTSKDKKRKVDGQNHVGTPRKKKKVYWPKVKGQAKRKTIPKVPNENKTTGDKVSYKRTPKSKSAKKSKDGASNVDEGSKFNMFCCGMQHNARKHGVQDELPSSLEEQIILEKTPSRSKRKSTKRSLMSEIEEKFEEHLHAQHGLDEVGFEGDSSSILEKKIPQKRINRSCPLLVKIRKLKLNIPTRKRSESQKKKRIQKLELLSKCMKKQKRSNNRCRKINLYGVLFRNPTSLSKQGVEEEKENQVLEDKFKWKTKGKRTMERKRKEKAKPTNFTTNIIPEKELGIWEMREGSKAVHSMSDFDEYPIDEDSMSDDGVEDKRKGKIRRKITKANVKKISIREMKVLIRKFQSLNINHRNIDPHGGSMSHKRMKESPVKNQDKGLVPYKGAKGQRINNSELVSYKNQDSEIVSYKGLKEGQRTRVKVNLDSQTLKEWNLLMDGKSHDENEDNREYWKQERAIYLGRVNAFIARMHNFLGNRSFSPWKGSVLDSVIGVFLTQNVSDHLSSSAYMSLVSTFPIKTPSKERKDNVPLLKFENSSETSTTNDSLNLRDKKLYPPGMVFGKKKSFSTRKKGDQTEQERKKKEEQEAEEQDKQYWESLRRMYIQCCSPRDDHADSADWEAVRCADVNKVAKAIEGRGQHNIIAQRVQAFLNKLIEMHGSTDLEWLRYAPPNQVKEYLLKVYGLGLKSVECIRLLALKHVAFPVDVNVGRIAVRLGWVPLEPLPGSIQFHLLDQYPIIDMVQQYLWPRLCTLDQPTLYQLHYHLITFGKVLCTKKQPNCKACPMRGECKHFASASASPTFALPGNDVDDGRPNNNSNRSNVPTQFFEGSSNPLTISNVNYATTTNTKQCEPIVDYPASPSPENMQIEMDDIEDFCKSDEDSEEFITINLNEERTKAADNYFENDMENSNVVVAFNSNRVSKSMPKMKSVGRLRTERMVYVLPDTHPLLVEFPLREADDPSSYLLVMWTPGELKETCEATRNQSGCSSSNFFSCNNIKEENNQTVPGTILVPCRTATSGRFPLNGTYFQVNEVFADAASSQHPIDVPTRWLWNLPIRIAYFGTSTSTILRGLPLEEIQECFWRGFVCVRAIDRGTGAPRPLPYRFHCKTADQLIMKKKRAEK